MPAAAASAFNRSISGQPPGEGASLLGAHRDRQDVDDPRYECQGPDHAGAIALFLPRLVGVLYLAIHGDDKIVVWVSPSVERFVWQQLF